MNRVTFSGENVSLSYIWEWYQVSEKAIHRERKRVLDALSTDNDVGDFFVGMNREDVDGYFQEYKRELEFLVCFDIISAAEGYLRMGYLNRVYKRLKDPISRKFRALYKRSGPKIRLSEDILGALVKEYPSCSMAIGQFRGILNLRDWLAHGRYWVPKLGRQYTPEDAFEVVVRLFEIMPAES